VAAGQVTILRERLMNGTKRPEHVSARYVSGYRLHGFQTDGYESHISEAGAIATATVTCSLVAQCAAASAHPTQALIHQLP
jgi:hypothetical protein